MSTDIRTISAAPLVGDVDFRAWCQVIHDQLVAAGLVQTADTGQINLATVAKPVAVNTAAGYEMFRFSDALQASKPVFIKIEYGTGTAVNQPALWITTGTATSGAGVLTGVTQTTRKQVPAGVAAGLVLNSYASGDGSRFFLWFSHDPTVGARHHFIAVERLKDSGGLNVDGVATLGASGQTGINTGQLQSFLHGLAPAQAQNHLPTLPLFPASGWPNIGSDLAVSPAMIPAGRWRYILPLSYRPADLTDLVPFEIEHLGELRTYMPMGGLLTAMPSCAANPGANVAAGQSGWAIPWE